MYITTCIYIYFYGNLNTVILFWCSKTEANKTTAVMRVLQQTLQHNDHVCLFQHKKLGMFTKNVIENQLESEHACLQVTGTTQTGFWAHIHGSILRGAIFDQVVHPDVS